MPGASARAGTALRRAALAALLLLATLPLAGCGSHKPRPAALRVERADLVLLAHTLRQLQGPVQGEVIAARAAWPAIAGGLPASVAPASRLQIATAERRAAAISLPGYLDMQRALTGPAAQLGGLLRAYTRLTQRGWGVLAAAARTGHAGSAAAASFLRANSGLYVYCVYDGHYDISLVGTKLQDGYRKLGGPGAFGAALTSGEVEALARIYSIDATRLEPHPSSQVHV